MKFGMSPSDGVLDIAHANFSRVQFAPVLRLRSLPTNLDAVQGGYESSTPSARNSPRGRPRLTLSQARLIIPRTESEYRECCRFARAHSEGLLFAATPASQVAGALAGCRDIVPTALSEGLLGGRLCAARPQDRRPQESEPKEVPPTPVEELEVGAMLEGRIVRVAPIGFFIDVHATRPGLLTRRQCKLIPKQMLKKGETFSNLVVLSVNKKKRQFTLGLRGIGHDGDEIQEVAYDAILRRIAAWAGVELPEEEEEKTYREYTGARRKGRGRGRGRGRGQPQRVWRVKKQPGDAEEEAVGAAAAAGLPADDGYPAAATDNGLGRGPEKGEVARWVPRQTPVPQEPAPPPPEAPIMDTE